VGVFRIVCEQIAFQSGTGVRSATDHHHPSATHSVLTLINAPFDRWGPITFAPGNLVLIEVSWEAGSKREDAIMVLDWQAGEMVHVCFQLM